MWKPRIQLWLEVALSFLHYICVSPYRFRYNHETDSYSYVSGIFYKILPFFVHTLGIIQTCFGLHAKTTVLNLDNPKCMFHSMVAYSQYVFYYAMIFTIWTRRSHFEAFFSFAYPPQSKYDKPKDNTKVTILVWFLCIMMIPVGITIELWNSTEFTASFTEFIMGSFNRKQGPSNIASLLGLSSQSGVMPPSPPSSPQLQQMMTPSPLPNGFPPPPPPETPQQQVMSQIVGNVTMAIPPPIPLITTTEFVITVVYEVVSLYVKVCNHVTMIFSIMAAITMYQAATTFMMSIGREKNQDKVINYYLDFCQFGSLLNRMCGWVVFGTVICCPPFFVVYLMATLNNADAAGPRIIFYSIIYCLICGISSEAASKVGELKEWILDNGEGENESQFYATYVELSNNPMGLKGLRFFTITYGLVAQMLGAIVTFTIILLQFETTPPNPIINSYCHI